MVIYTTRPVKELETLEFKELIHDKVIIISPHAFDHLSRNQRKIFKEEDLIYMIQKENPRKIYIQENKRYAAYYRKSDGYRKIVTEVQDKSVVIVTFTDPKEIPKINLQNGKN